ncbi:MAG TPA: ABC transporter permease [Fibrobacteraceae bacterium]|nr:ABC transporter permease [Fibrobacteraceae bacterium]
MDEYLVYHGELMPAHHLWRRGFFFVLPAVTWISAFLVLPGLMLVAVAFAQRGEYGNIEWTFTWENLRRLAGYDLFGWSADNLWILGRSLWVALIATVLCVLVSYPLAFFLAGRPKETRQTWMVLLLIPFWTNLVIRTYAWLLVLAPEMPPAKLLSALGLLQPGSPAYPSSVAVWLGMLSSFLPFVALPLYTAVEKIDWALVEASRDLYAGTVRTFWQAIFPQTLPGISVGITLTLVPAMGMFVVPDMLGGARYMLIGNLIQQQFGTARDWPFGAMLSLALMGLTLLTLMMAQRKRRNSSQRMAR